MDNRITDEFKKRNYGLWLAGGLAGMFLVIMLAVILALVFSLSSALKNLTLVPPAPPPKVETPVEPPPVVKTSRFASDSALLQVRKDLTDLRTQIDSMDLFEPQLSPPSVDLDIKINPL